MGTTAEMERRYYKVEGYREQLWEDAL